MAARSDRSDPGSTRADAAMLSIGALSKATGIPVETLRTWERRYRYPQPGRKPSGHRVYPVSSIARLRRIAEALARGHRAGEVVAAGDAELEQLLRVPSVPGDVARGDVPGDDPLPRLLDGVEAFEGDRVTRLLLAEYARLGPLDFVHRRVGPLLVAIGCAWAEGRFEIRHEHFISERVGDLLRSLRLPYEERASGPPMVLATLPGERHTLGLQMAALTVATAGFRVLYLGAEVPLPEIVALGRERGARAVAVSVSIASGGTSSAQSLHRLRELMPRRMALVVGGRGAPDPGPRFVVATDLTELDAWARHLLATSGA